MTPMNNKEYLTRIKFAHELQNLKYAKKESGLSFDEINVKRKSLM